MGSETSEHPGRPIPEPWFHRSSKILFDSIKVISLAILLHQCNIDFFLEILLTKITSHGRVASLIRFTTICDILRIEFVFKTIYRQSN